MAYVQIGVFVIVTLITAFLFGKRARFIYRNIKLGKPADVSDNKSERLKNMALIAFGQQKMFKNLLAAVLHLFVYVAFLVTQIELIEIILDGITGQHRILYYAIYDIAFLKGLYIFIVSFIEVLSVLALLATFAFLARRNLLKIPRFTMLNGWPKLDANIILFAEIYLVACIFTMNGADMALNDGKYGFPVSGLLLPFFESFSEGTLIIMERVGWWGHILGVFSFLVYVTYSKHLHIILAFPNVFAGRIKPKGQLSNMDAVTKEIRLMMDPNADPYAAPAEPAAEPEAFGAKDVTDLSDVNLLNAYTCTECGRCTAACPANQTGKLLSPRKIMMDTRDRLEEVGKNIDANGGEFKPDGKQLLGDYITVEELRACTTCNACVEECPVQINPLDIIVQLRQALIMEDSNSPEEWNLMFNNMENNGAPWQFNPQERVKWAEELAKEEN